jgi:hypothetical protein
MAVATSRVVARLRPPSARAPRAASFELIASALFEVDEVSVLGDLALIGLAPPRVGLARAGGLAGGSGLGGLLRRLGTPLLDCGPRVADVNLDAKNHPRDLRAGAPTIFDVTAAGSSRSAERFLTENRVLRGEAPACLLHRWQRCLRFSEGSSSQVGLMPIVGTERLRRSASRRVRSRRSSVSCESAASGGVWCSRSRRLGGDRDLPHLPGGGRPRCWRSR